MKIRMFHISPVDKEILMRAFLTGGFRLADKSRDIAYRCLYVNGQYVVIEFLAEHIYYTLSQAAFTQVEHLHAIAMERKVYLWINKHNTLKSSKDVIKFRRVRLQEFTSCRDVEEYIVYRKVAFL